MSNDTDLDLVPIETVDADLFGGASVDSWCVSAGELANLFNVSVSMIHKYASKYGMPKEARGSFNVKTCVRWYVDDFCKTYLLGGDGEGNQDRSKARENLTNAQEERIRLEIEEKKRLVIPGQQVHAVFTAIAAIVSTQLDSFGPAHAAILADMSDPAAIQDYLFHECRSIRSAIAGDFDSIASRVVESINDSAADHSAAAEA